VITYQTNAPRGWGGDPKRGAALGRATIDEPDEDTYKTELILMRVPVNDGGYDPLGTYFGARDPGTHLYWLAAQDGKIDRVFSAKDDPSAIAYAGNLYTLAKIPTKVEGIKVDVGDVELDAFTQQYLEAALEISLDNSNDSGGSPLDENYGVDDFDPEFLLEAKQDCEDFQEAQAELLDRAYAEFSYNEENAGRDFWLTRNGHGAGFWDRGLGEVGDALSKAAKVFGGVDLYVGDDGKIYG